MSKKLKINGYNIQLNDDFRPDDYYHYVCAIYVNDEYVCEVSRERNPHLFDIGYDNREECLQAGIPQDIINKAIEAAKKCILNRQSAELKQNADGLYDDLLEKDPELTRLHYPPTE